MKKLMIWTSIIDLEDYEDFFADAYPDITDDNEKWQICQEINNGLLEDERCNLNYHHPIIGIADLGLWNGRRQAVGLFKNLKDILTTNCDEAEWFVEGSTLKGTMWHRDGTNYVYYYLFQEDVPGADKFVEDLKNGVKVSKSRLYKYCKSAGKVVREIYGLGKVA